MTAPPDRLVRLANHPWARQILRDMGVPQPRVLRRATTAPDAQALRGRRAGVVALPGGFAHGPVREALAAAGATLVDAGGIDALVADATGCRDLDALRALRENLQGPVQRLAEHGRMVLLAPAEPTSPEAAACARALEGFLRSLARELGRRGATANLVALPPSAARALPPVLGFLASDRSAFVSGQPLQLREPVPAPAPAGQRNAVVTGAAAGIGAATALRLAAEGVHVLCVDRPETLHALEEVARRAHGTPLPLDVTAADAPQRLVDAVALLGGVDVLVHNAGVTRDRTFGRMQAAEWDLALDVNLGAVLALDAALDAAGALHDGGREICLASISGIAGNAGQSNYAAAKAGLIGYTQARAVALAARGITANAVAPGFIETGMTRRIPFLTREAGRRLNSLMQGGVPEDVAEAIAFLARPDAGGVSGQVLRVCGQSWLGA